MGVIAENAFAYNGDKSKFDLGRIFLRKKVTLTFPAPSNGKWGICSYKLPFAPVNGSDIINYNYKPIAVHLASQVNGFYFCDITLYQSPQDNQQWTVKAYINNHSGVSPATVSVEAYVWYMRQDIIRILPS